MRINDFIKSATWYKGTIPALTESVRNYATVNTIAVLAIKYVGSDTYHAVRCQNALSTDGAFELWLYSGLTRPNSASQDISGTIKISYVNKTAQFLATEINKLNGWEAKCLYNCPRISSGELWNYFGDFSYTFPRSSTGYWTDYSGLTYTPEKTFSGEYIIRVNRFVALYDSGASLEVFDPGTVNIYSPWYFRINPGYMRIINDTGSYLYTIPEYDSYKCWSQKRGYPYISIQKSVPLSVSGTTIKVQHINIEDVVVYVDGKIANIKHIHKNHGIIEMVSHISNTSIVNVSYDYLERFFLYRKLNVNPRLNSSVYNKYIIIYATPYNSIEAGVSTISENCIHHSIGDTIAEAYSAISENNVVILSISKFERPTGYSFLDLRTAGGGALDVSYLSNLQPESDCYTDISEFCGKSYPGNGSIVINVPEDLDISRLPDRIYNYLAVGVDYIVKKENR